MENKYHNVINTVELLDSLFAIDGLGPIESHQISPISLNVPLNENINWAIYIDTDHADTEIEKEYMSIWLHNYYIRHIIKETAHNKERCKQCNTYYHNFVKAIEESLTNHTTSYALEYLAKWMIFINYHNDDLMNFVEEHSHSTELLFMTYYILYWGTNNNELPHLYQILNKYCPTIKELLCKYNLVNDYINFRISGHEDDEELNKLQKEYSQEFYKDLPQDYQLNIMI